MKRGLILFAFVIIVLTVFVYAFLSWKPYQTESQPQKYYIEWKSKITGFTGQGSISFPADQANEMVQKANWRHPEIEHYLIEVKVK